MKLTAIQIEGNILTPDITSLLSTGSIKGQQPEDFGLAKTDKLADEIATAWGDAKAYWAAFQRKLARLPEDNTATTITREWAVSLLESLGYKPILTRQAEEVDGQTYAISHRALTPKDAITNHLGETSSKLRITNYELPITNYPPIHIIGCRLKLDQRPPSGTPRLSAHGLVQEYLNKTEHLWAITTNGYRWRLLRDSSLMTRLSYVEFDLEQILNSENFAEFSIFYRLFHRSRLPEGMDDADKCLLEFYHQETLQQGGRVRDKLRDGVEEALKYLGNGFLQHPHNEDLRQKFSDNYELRITNYELTFYRQLLRLIYRLLFLMVAEARDLLLVGDDGEKGQIYREYYSVERLRRLAERPSYRREGFQDLWRGLCVTFKLFDENWRGKVLGLSPLNGDLFGSNTLPDIDNCAIDNYDLLQAIKHLSLYVDKNGLRRVNYASLDVEELGSVYESLLDFHPQVRVNQQGEYEFALVYGSDRKTTGSFYTPPQLVQQLIKTALEPVIQERLSRSHSPAGNASPEAHGKIEAEPQKLRYQAEPSNEDNSNNYELRITNYELQIASPEAHGKIEAEPQKLRYQAEPSNEDNSNNYELRITNYELQITNYELELLSLKVVDPACGSGHFLLAAARRIGKELARVRTGETEPGKEPLNLAIRDVIQNCIYGVDINPLAVDLCKVALWIEGFYRGMPLNFLDHRIKCGNSLVGVLDLEVLQEGIPDDAYKAVTGDNKTLSTQLKKRNKKERENQGQLSIFDSLETERSEYIEKARMLGKIDETTPQEVREKQAKYQESRNREKNPHWWRDYSACNLWTAAFFMGLTEENLQLLPTNAALSRLLRSSTFAVSEQDVLKRNYEQSIQKIVDAANKLAAEKQFFHWHLEFPEVFNPEPTTATNSELPSLDSHVAGTTNYESRITNYELKPGFDCVLGNPPWELLQIAEKEFFASRSAEIANAANKAAREKLIKELPKKNPELAQAFDDAKHDAEAQNKFIRESGRFPLTAVGKINTYAVFAETTRKLISSEGRVGIIVPTGIATDDTCKQFFGDLTQKEALASLYDFENRDAIFPAVHRSYKFSLLAISGKAIKRGNFAFFLTQTRQLENQERQFQLSPQDIALLNPNTLTCPVFRTRADAELTKKIYERVPVLENEKTGSNPWGISFMQGLFNMSSDSGLFQQVNQQKKETITNYELPITNSNPVPLYEAKMFHQFDHRWATYTNSSDTRDVRDEEKCDPHYQVQPRYWVSRNEVENKLAGKWDKKWLLGFRDITNSTNERTAIFSLLPRVGVGHTAPIFCTHRKDNKLIACLLANCNCLIFDFVSRQKIGGTHLTFTVFKQLPVLPPESYTQENIEYISTRVLELVYTSWEMEPFAQDIWKEADDKMRKTIIKQWQNNQKANNINPETNNYELRITNYELQNYELRITNYELPPFSWNPNRRAILRAELDAYYAKLYGLTRNELRYILDPADVYGEDFPSETFRVLKNNEMKKYGEYRTQRLVLEAWDKLGL